MTGGAVLDIDRELTAASVTPLVLSVLSEGESHGYAILERVRELSEEELGWADGMVYPLFRRLRRMGYLTSEWRDLPEGRRRRFYAITDDGRAALTGRRNALASRVTGVWPGSGNLLAVLRHLPHSILDRPSAWNSRPPLRVA